MQVLKPPGPSRVFWSEQLPICPKQAQGKPLDERSDVFSVGALLHEMLSGQRAFAGDLMAETLSSVLRDEPAALDCGFGLSWRKRRAANTCYRA
jgi:hypothetical protein